MTTPSTGTGQKLLDLLRTTSSSIAAIVAVVTFVWLVVQPHVTSLILNSIPKNAYADATEFKRLEEKVDDLAASQDTLRVQNSGIRESLSQQESNLRILIYMMKGKESFEDLPQR